MPGITPSSMHTTRDCKPFRMPGIVPKLSETPGGTDRIGPELGAHTDAVLAALGYDAAAIAAAGGRVRYCLDASLKTPPQPR